MSKSYVLSQRNDAELEQAIHEMNAYHLRVALFGIARGWGFDESFSIAEDAAQQSVQRIGCTHPAERCVEHDGSVFCFECRTIIANR